MLYHDQTCYYLINFKRISKSVYIWVEEIEEFFEKHELTQLP